ncbi:DUF2788 domain-containing protein [Gallaecimonas pentaromativorans]|uniref:Uncharacterized protein DUF2788 n=1 Tax=Gallaecimonas pentaromativorans TaxID=584787 RepID=A0A3N1PLX4_9GAMM|nr:DUF2788 domain-containing protein [Gallaecimonas pentaromativorans]MED5525992.1 DUF2788 domain-containing protein [Pseudomonadota bacterium]ROQ29695.1 uncharacterized protein DUF2788 [Gallaecimonas pentaromativorans]
MLDKHHDTLGSLGLNLFFLFIVIALGLAINDVLKKSQVTAAWRFVVWLAILGAVGFAFKTLIWESSGIG